MLTCRLSLSIYTVCEKGSLFCFGKATTRLNIKHGYQTTLCCLLGFLNKKIAYFYDLCKKGTSLSGNRQSEN